MTPVVGCQYQYRKCEEFNYLIFNQVLHIHINLLFMPPDICHIFVQEVHHSAAPIPVL